MPVILRSFWALPVRALVAASLALALAGCEPDSSSPSPNTTVREFPDNGAPVIPTSSLVPEVPYDAGCSPAYPRRESLTANQPGVRYLEDLALCSGRLAGVTVYSLANNSPAVWIFFSSHPSLEITKLLGNAASDLFRETVAEGRLYQYEYMAPSEVMGIPSVLVQDQQFELRIEPDLTAAWLGQDVLIASYGKLGEAAVVAALAKGSAKRRALVQCAISYALLLRSDELSGETSEEKLLAAFGMLGTAGTCAKAWRLAEQEGAETVPKFAVAVERAGTAAESVSKIRTGWKWLKGICVAVRYC